MANYIELSVTAFLERHGMQESEDARLYRHNTRKGLEAELPGDHGALSPRAMAAAIKIRMAARRVRRKQRMEAQRAAAAR